MRKFLFLLLAVPVFAQPSNSPIVSVTVAPSGSCASGLPNQQVISTGVMYSCQNGTWGAINGGGGGSGTVNTGTTPLAAYYPSNGTSVSPATNPVTGAATTVPTFTGFISPLHPAALRSLKTKEGLISLNLGGHSGYSSTAQIYIIQGGDSVTGYHSNELACTVAYQYGFAGYINSAPTGTAQQFNYPCPTQGSYFGPTLAGGAAAVTGDFNHFIGGSGWSLPTGSTATNSIAFTSTRIMAYFTADVGTTTVTVSTSTDNVTYTPLPSCTTLAVSANVGGVCDTTIASGGYYVRVTAGGTGTVYLWSVGQVNTGINGAVVGSIGVSGTSLADQASVPSAIWQPWITNIHPDVVTFEMRNNGSNVVGYPTCTQANTASPGVGQTRSYWWNLWITPFQTANPLADIIYFGAYDSSDTCLPVYNQVEQAWAYAQAPEQTYVDNFWQLTDAQQQTLGWKDNSTHQTALGQVAEGDLDMDYLGVVKAPTAQGGNLAVPSYVTTNHLYTSASPTLLTATLGLCNPASALCGNYASSNTYANSNGIGSTFTDVTNQWSIWDYTHTNPLFCLNTYSSGVFPTGCKVTVNQNGLMTLTQLQATNSTVGTFIMSESTFNNSGGSAYFRRKAGATSAFAGDTYEYTSTEEWRVGMNGSTNYQIKDSVGAKAILNFASNVGPANSYQVNASGPLLATTTLSGPLIIGATKFTATGCTSITSTVGNGAAGKFTIGAATCTVVITINGATGMTATNGWSCYANDVTTAAGNTGLYFSANSTTTATLTVPATAVASDVIDFACRPY